MELAFTNGVAGGLAGAAGGLNGALGSFNGAAGGLDGAAGSLDGFVRGLDGAAGGLDGVVRGLSGVCGGDPAGFVAFGLDVVVAGLRALGVSRLDERLMLVGRCESRLAAVRSETIAELTDQRGESRAADEVRRRLKESRGRARGEVKLAGQLAGMPGTAEALAGGSITAQQAKIIADAAEQAPIDEAMLLTAAETQPVDELAETARRHVNERTSTDDLEERRRRQHKRRKASFARRSDGMYKMYGEFDPLAGARIESALAKALGGLFRAEDAKDRRTPEQRMADAIEELITRDGSGKAQQTELLVTAEYELLAEIFHNRDSVGRNRDSAGRNRVSLGRDCDGGAGRLFGAGFLDRLRDPQLDDGTPLTPEELRRLSCDALILPGIFDRKGQPLWLGAGHRHANRAQRKALAKRDKGCVGCGWSPRWCQAHHIVHWADDGPTDLDNLVLLCHHCHHHRVHTLGYQVVRDPDGHYSLQDPKETPAPPPTPAHASSANGALGNPLRC